MILFLDTSSQDFFIISIFLKNQLVFEKKFISSNRTNFIFSSLNKAFKKVSLSFKDIIIIAITVGPKDFKGKKASYTGLRISASIANAISQISNAKILSITVNKKILRKDIYEKILNSKTVDLKDFVLPKYEARPNITSKKSIC